MSLRVLGLALALVVGMTMTFGLVPSLVLVRRHTANDLKAGGRGSSRDRRALHQGLVVAEVALACALVVASALLVRTVDAMTRVPLGVAPKNVVLAGVQLSAGFTSGRLAGRRRRARDHPRADPAAARRPLGGQHEHPPDGSRLAEPVPASRSDVRPPRRPAAGAIPLGQRGLLRDDGRDARRRTGVHRARHARERGRGHRQPDAGAPVLSGTLGGRPRDRVDAGAGRSPGAQPDVDDPAGRRSAGRRRGRASSAWSPTSRTCRSACPSSLPSTRPPGSSRSAASRSPWPRAIARRPSKPSAAP